MSSDSEDSDVQAVQRNRRLRQQFDASSSPSASTPPPPPTKTATAKRRPLPRFLGDDLDDDGGNSNTDDLFAGLDDVPNALPQSRRRAFDFDGGDDEEDDEEGNGRKAKSGTDLDGLDIDAVGGGLGDGMEVDGVVKKKRKPIAKMDDNRLMGPNGFPKLRSEITAFRPRGKGHEAKDLKRLMSLYQLWAHQMYPKTNLRDTLQTIEKLCHKRSMQRALKEYRDEAKLERSRAAALLDPDPERESAATEHNLDDTSTTTAAQVKPESMLTKKKEQVGGPSSPGPDPQQEPNEEEDMYGFDFDEEAERMMLEFEQEGF